MISSKLLAPNQRLKDCAVKDPAHVTLGDRGEHVRLIHAALLAIDSPVIAQDELSAGLYGKTTAAAVLQYKTKRKIVNPAYQSRPDDIVGKMTIKSLDGEMLKLEGKPSKEPSGAVLRPVRGRMT